MADTVLLYTPKESTKALRMKPAMLRMGVRIKIVTDEMLTMTIREILGLTNQEEAEQEVNDGGHQLIPATQVPDMKEEVMVMYGFTSGKIDILLQNLRKAGVAKVNLKAIVTPNNLDWTFAQLTAELIKEHKAYMDQ